MNRRTILMVSFLLIILTMLFFFEFFTKGWLLEGTGDRILSVVPMEINAQRSLHNWRLPEWIPHVFCGAPYIASGYHNFFYPIKFLILCFPEKCLLFLLTLSAALHMFLSGIFFFIFAFSVVKNKFWSLVGAISYAFSFTLTYNLNYGDDCVIGLVYMPMLLYFINTHKARSASRNYLFYTILLSIVILSGNMQLVLYLTGMAFLYGLFKSEKAHIPVILAAFITAGFLTAIRTFPFIELAKSYSGSFTAPFDELSRFDLTRPISLIRLFAPFFLSGDNALFFMGGLGPPVSFNVYHGLIGAFLIVYAFIFIWDKETNYWKLISFLIILIILGTPLARLQFILMGKTYLSFSKYAWLLPIPLALMICAAGAKISESATSSKRFTIFAIICAFIVSGILLYTYHDTVKVIARLAAAKQALYLSKETILLSLLKNMRYSFLYFAVGSLYVIMIAVTLGQWTLNKFRMKLAILLFLSIDILTISRANINSMWNFLSKEPMGKITDAEKNVIDMFQTSCKDFRMTGQTNNTKLDAHVRLGLYKPSGWGLTIPTRLAYLYRLENMDRIATMGRFPRDEKTIALSSTAFDLKENGTILSSKYCIPRAKLFSNYIVVKDDESARGMLFDPSFDVMSRVILHENISIDVPNKDFRREAEIIEDNNETVKIKTCAAENSILLLTDTFHDGWKASIDGKSAEILRANIAFKALLVPAGEHEIIFSYRQAGLRGGAVVSLITLISFLIILFTRVYSKNQKS